MRVTSNWLGLTIRKMDYWKNLKIGFQGIGRAYAWQINPQQALAELHYQYMLLLKQRALVGDVG